MPLLINKLNTDPFFYFGLKNNMPVPYGLNSTHTNNFFEYTLKQNPNNLSCHLQRIKFSLSKKSQNDFFAALCDLFIILGQQGFSLRKRLLQYAGEKLPQEQTELLAPYLTEKNMSNNLDFLPELCFFKKEKIDLLRTSSQEDQQPQKAEDIIQTIESYIEHSQFDAAKDCLLQELHNNPENELLTIKLINLYKVLNYSEEFNQAYNQFANCLLTSRYWEEASQYFIEKA